MIAHEELMERLGDAFTNQVVVRLHRLAHLPEGLLSDLTREALAEQWGQDNYALTKYLAVHIAWAIEQNKYTTSQDQLYVTAGHLQTRYGTPIYLVFERNRDPGRQPLYLVRVGSDISAPSLPTPPDIPAPPQLPQGAEVVMLHGHILGDNAERVPFLAQTPPVAQICAVSGAIQWAIFRGLQLPYWYYGQMNYLVPLYLQSRENITLAPDLIAPIQVTPDSLIVRTVLLPQMPYANARVAVRRHDQLPHWLIDAWNENAARATRENIDDPEPQSALPANRAPQRSAASGAR